MISSLSFAFIVTEFFISETKKVVKDRDKPTPATVETSSNAEEAAIGTLVSQPDRKSLPLISRGTS